MDGVLIDSEPLWQRAEIELFGEIGVTLTPELCARTMGLRIDEVVAHWHREFPWGSDPTPEEMVDRIVGRMVQLVGTEGGPIAGVREAIEEVERRGLRKALATSSYEPIMRAVLDRLDLQDRFEVILAGSDVERGKPNPEIYLTAAERMGLPPQRCLAVEDSVNGVRAAKAAGMMCVAIPDVAKGDARFDEADVIVDDLLAFASWLEDVVPVDEEDRQDPESG